MALSIEQLRAAFKTEDTKQSRPNNYYPFWDMKTGEQCVVRFLPDKNPDNPLGFMVEKLMHNLVINGENKTVPCLKMYEEDCPICNVSRAYYKDKDEANGKKYWRKKQHLAQALIVEDPLDADKDSGENHEGKVRFIALGYQIYNIIKESFESGELDEIPFAYEGGCDFIIKKTEQGKYASYAVGTRFARKASDLDDDTIASVEDEMIELETLLPAMPELARVEGMLEAALSGGEYAEGDVPKAEKKADKPAAKISDEAPFKADKPVAEAKAEPEAEEEFDEDVDVMLAQIRARQNKKA